MTDYAGALWVPNNNAFPNRNGYSPRYIVLHSTAGGSSAQAIAEYFASTQGTANPVSAHYVVGIDGAVVQCVNERDGAWANGFVSGQSGTSGDGEGNGFHDSWWDSGVNPNLISISIEHVKSAVDNSSQLTDAQKQASFKLIRDICQRHNIPMCKADAQGGVTGHYAIDPVNRANCPGSYPWDELWTFLESNGGPMVPQDWTDNGTVLKAPNGHTVTLGFRDYILNNNWPSGNWPLEEAHGQTPLELSNPSLGGGTQQVFRWSVLEWTPSQGVFVSWVGQELLKMRALLAQEQPQTPTASINVPQAISDLQTIQAALGNVITTLKG
jgi:N-acetyl-anhydromuramyl-L-alanine amidase AmpD